jgi:tetratricopeptide (TPR) repeat protein
MMETGEQAQRELFAKARAATAGGDKEEALRCYDAILAIGAAPPPVWFNRGVLLEELGRSSEALPCYQKVVEAMPHVPAHWGQLGICLLRLRRCEEAIEALDRCLAIDPKMLLAAVNKARALAKLDRHEEAIAWFDTVLAQSPQPAIMNEKSLSLVALGRVDEADALQRSAFQGVYPPKG